MLKSLVIFFAVALSATANALPLQLTADSEVSFSNVAYNYNGIVRLSNCSASVVKFRGDSDDKAALLLTNGHCLGRMPGPGEVVYKKPANMNVEFLSDDGRTSVGKAKATEVIYGTMTDTDLALLRLDKSYQAIKSQFKVNALVIAERAPEVGTPIQVISGYWRRGYSCNVDGYVHILKEGDWTFKKSLRYSEEGCKVIGGTSGSPVVSVTSGEVVAINNTINQADGKNCSMNNPCEINEQGDVSVYVKGGYAQHTDWLYTCLNDRGDFDLKTSGCVLPKPR